MSPVQMKTTCTIFPYPPSWPRNFRALRRHNKSIPVSLGIEAIHVAEGIYPTTSKRGPSPRPYTDPSTPVKFKPTSSSAKDWREALNLDGAGAARLFICPLLSPLPMPPRVFIEVSFTSYIIQKYSTHTHTHIYIYIYICTHTCICACIVYIYDIFT
jgi:hypothetical protein